MLTVSNLSVQFGKRILFDEVNTTFTQGTVSYTHLDVYKRQSTNLKFFALTL